MSKITERTGMITARLLLAALIGAFVLVCFAQPEAPEVSIEIVSVDGVEHIRLNWQEIEGAEVYNIYASNEAEPADWGEPIDTVGDSVFTYTIEPPVNELGRSHFFYVTAYQELDIPDWLVLVEGGRFNPTDDYTVTLSSFYISKYEVTQREFFDVMEFNPSRFTDPPDVAVNRPVERVHWFDCIEYCNRLSIREGLTPAYSYNGRTDPDDWYDQWPDWNTEDANHNNVTCNWEADGYRLLTEMEWEFAARGGIPAQEEGTFDDRWAGTDDEDLIGNYAWHLANAGGTTHPVGEKQPNELGLYDMSGNVAQWLWDRHAADLPVGEVNDPRDPDEGTNRGRRGFAYMQNLRFFTLFRRFGLQPTNNHNASIGFRIGKSAP